MPQWKQSEYWVYTANYLESQSLDSDSFISDHVLLTKWCAASYIYITFFFPHKHKCIAQVKPYGIRLSLSA